MIPCFDRVGCDRISWLFEATAGSLAAEPGRNKASRITSWQYAGARRIAHIREAVS